jgi:uncharacterized protein (DUF1684 family)
VIASAILALTLAPAPSADAHRAEIEAWRLARLERLSRPDGWLTLAGLFWLEEGPNPFGSDPANRVVLPAGMPPCMGELVLEGGTVRARLEPGVELTARGKPAAAIALRSDADGEPTVLEYEPISFYVIKRRDRFAVRVKNSANPALLTFTGIDSFPIEPAWRFEARFEPYDPPKEVLVPNVIGGADREKCPGAIVFELGGQIYRLEPVRETGTEDLFVIFGDRTNGSETYGGGRFLYARPPDQDGRVILDFNKAYNPPCVFTPYATCPLPPPGNRLPLRVEAGERAYGEH